MRCYPGPSLQSGSKPRVSPSLPGWSGLGLRVGAVVGGIAGAAGALAAVLWSPGPRPPALKLLAAATTSAAGAGLCLFVLAALTAPLLRFRPGRVLAVGLQAALAATFFGTHLTSSVLKVLSGSYLSLGAVEFFLAGGPHLLWTIVVGYGRFITLLALVIGVVAWLVVRHARRTLAAAQPAPSVARLALFTCLASAGLVPAGLSADLALASPELAFVESMSPEDPEPVAPQPGPERPANAPEPPPREPAEGPPLAAGQLWAKAVRASPAVRTNVLLLTLESISIRHLGYFGYERGTTPNLDRIAQRSLRARRAWTTATHSNYAQMAILSSLFPRRTTGLDVYKRLDYPRTLLHDVFHTIGHATATISSQDETWQGMIKFQETGTPTFYRHSKNYTGTRLDIGSELVVLDHVTVDVAADWIQRQGAHPWSLYVNFQATHFPYKLQAGIPTPYQPTKLTPGGFDYLSYPEGDRQAVINRYDNALRYVDEQVGKLERALERAGKLDDTIWVITADHGENFHDHGQVTHGKTLYDSEARVPLLIHWPKGLKSADVNEPVSHLDILPTLLDLLNLPPHPAFQGRSMLEAPDPSRETPGIYLNIQGLKSAEAIVCWPWKLVVNRSDKTTQLFQLEQDPEERDDRLERDAKVADALRATLSAQISAQLAYHKKDSTTRTERHAPRLLTCPNLPDVQRAAAPEPDKPETARPEAPPLDKAPERKN